MIERYLSGLAFLLFIKHSKVFFIKHFTMFDKKLMLKVFKEREKKVKLFV